jgi:outer membrane protein OmpA-like peptidoglycan-associated protein
MRWLWLAIMVPLALAGCASTPETSPQLNSARTTYQQVAAHPEVPLRAPGELQLAGRSLAEAERLAKSGADPALVAHLAYLADQRARIALATAEYRKAEALVATSGEQRNRVLLEARTRELEAQKLAQAAQKPQEPAARIPDPQPTQGGLVITLGSSLLFDSGETQLTQRGLKALDNVAQQVRNEPAQHVVIDGFTESSGSTDLNRQRAEAVKDALVARGIAAERIQARGYGPAYQIVIATNLR